jgi:hypothetical protein
MVSTMKFNSCESATAFINPRMHAGHTKLHDPINRSYDYPQKRPLLFVNFLLFAVVCHGTVMVVIACY